MAEMKKKIHGFSTSIFQGREDKRTKRQSNEKLSYAFVRRAPRGRKQTY